MGMDAFLQRVSDLSATEHKEVFNIICQCKSVRFMQNSNGTFVDMSTIPEDVLEAVQRFVDYCHNNKGMLEDYTNRMAECRMNQDFERLPRRSASSTHKPAPPSTKLQRASDHDADDGGCGGDADANAGDDADADAGDDAYADADDDESVSAVAADGTKGTATHTASAMTLSSVTRRMTTSKFNQAKKRIMRKRTSSGPATRCGEMSGFLMPERYIMHSPVQI
jgi:hypothetical protein